MKIKYFFISILPTLLIFACGNDDSEYSFTGILEGTSVKVPALTGGQITNIFVDTGDSVETNQLIARIDSTDLSFQQEQLSASFADLKIQEDIARTNLVITKNDFEFIGMTYDRIAKLFESKSVPKQQLDDAKNKLQKSELAYKTAKQNLSSLQAKQQMVSAQIKSIQKKIKDTAVLAPIGGIIANKYYEPGEAVQPMRPVVEIINLDEMETKIYISEKDLSRVKYEQQVTVKVDGITENLNGKVNWISPRAEFTPKTILTPETRTSLVYAVKILIENKDHLLKHGMPVVVQLNMGE